MTKRRCWRLAAGALSGAVALVAFPAATSIEPASGTTNPGARAVTAALPDMEILISGISISHPLGGPKELRFTHDTYDAGGGPLELQPHYDAGTGTASATQDVYGYDGGGNLVPAQQFAVNGTFAYDTAHGHYHFPLDSSGLYAVAPDGSPGTPIVMSPKDGWCIGDDTNPVSPNPPHTPGARGYDGGTCGDPTAVRGISVGWSDEYDFTDPGQSVPIDTVPDGTYWLGASVDPNGYLHDANRNNNATYVEITISGDNPPVIGRTIQTAPPATDPHLGGYWLVAPDGGIFAFGDATFYGSMGGHPLARPIVGIAATPSGNGYWEVASDGGIFAFGDATFTGSMGGRPLAKPIVGIAATPTGHGYWEVASDGGIFAFGDAGFFGALPGVVSDTVVDMKPTTDGGGYLLVSAAGVVYHNGDAPDYGDLSTILPSYRGGILAMAIHRH